MEFKEYMKKQMELVSMDISDIQLEQFYDFYKILVEKNKVMNLTGITEEKEVIQKHFIDSIILMKYSFFENAKECMDVGTGAGFPGIPLAIMNPDKHFVLLDSLNKRIQFIEEVIKKLQLENVEAYHGRAEDFARDTNFREEFSICVSRAVANLSSLSEFCIPFVELGGKFVSYKSALVEEELKTAENAIGILGGKLEETINFTLPETDIGRSLVVINKISTTPDKYPRSAGKPIKKPLS